MIIGVGILNSAFGQYLSQALRAAAASCLYLSLNRKSFLHLRAFGMSLVRGVILRSCCRPLSCHIGLVLLYLPAVGDV